MVNLTEINFDKLKKSIGESFKRQKSIGNKTNLKRLSLILLATTTIGSFTGCEEYVYETMDITGDNGIIATIEDETLLDEAFKLKKYKSLYSDLEKLESDIKTYDEVDINIMDKILNHIDMEVENPYNTNSFEANLNNFKNLKYKYDNGVITPDEAKELYSVCMTLKKQKEDFEISITDDAWQTIYDYSYLTVKIAFANAYEVNPKKLSTCLNNTSIATNDSNDNEILTYSVSDTEDKKFIINGASKLDDLIDKIVELDNNRNNITIYDIKEVLSMNKDILVLTFYIRSSDSSICRVEEGNLLFDKNSRRETLRTQIASETQSENYNYEDENVNIVKK